MLYGCDNRSAYGSEIIINTRNVQITLCSFANILNTSQMEKYYVESTMTIGRLDVFFSGFVNVGKDVAPDVDALLHVLYRFVKVFSCFLRLQRVGITNVHNGW